MPEDFLPTEGDQAKQKQAKSLKGRRSFLKKGGLLAAFTSVVSLTPFAPVHAATSSSQAAQTALIRLTGKEAAQYVKPVLASESYQQFLRQLTQQHPGIFSVQEQVVSVLLAKNAQEQLVSVRIPVEGGAGHSFYSAVFQAGSTAITMTRTGVFTSAGHGNITAIVNINGKTVLDAVLTPQGSFVQGTYVTQKGKTAAATSLNTQQVNGGVQPLISVSCINQCLSNLGLPGWVLSAISVGCAIACFFSAGAGCLVCLLGIAGGYEFEFAYCVGYCS